MKTTVGLIIAALVLVLAGAVAASSQARSEALTPTEVTQSFYAWYLDYIGDPADGTFRNPLVDGAYRTNPALAPEFVAHIDALLASFNGGGYDPFLCAQDIPMRLTVGDERISGKQATVTVSTLWTGNPMAYTFTLALERRGRNWQIIAINCQSGASRPLDAQETAQAFYDLYLEVAERRNPLADGIYRDLPFLAPEWVTQVDEILASFERGGYDPFLCAQDLPGEVVALEATVEGGTATVPMRTSFEGHEFAVTLRVIEGQWLITGIECQAP